MSEDEEFERINASYDRYLADPDDAEPEEAKALIERYKELRRKGHGPQPHNCDDDDND